MNGWKEQDRVDSKVGNTAIVTPVALVTPSQRVVLGTTDFACLRIDIAFELWRSTATDIGVQFLALAIGLESGRLVDLRCLVDLRLRGRGLGSGLLGDLLRSAEGAGGLLGQLVEDFLLFLGKAWRRRTGRP